MLKTVAIVEVHTYNYRGCRVYTEIKQKSQPKQLIQHSRANTTSTGTSTIEGSKAITRQGVSYASVMKSVAQRPENASALSQNLESFNLH